MKNQTRVSDSEWKVMKVLWQQAPLTSTEIIKKLHETAWSNNTIHTLLSRLVNKEVIGVQKTTRFKEYFPLISEKECCQLETDSFLKKVYNGSLKMLLTNYVSDSHLTDEDLSALREILNRNGKETK